MLIIQIQNINRFTLLAFDVELSVDVADNRFSYFFRKLDLILLNSKYSVLDSKYRAWKKTGIVLCSTCHISFPAQLVVMMVT
jgi:hypothetical protein